MSAQLAGNRFGLLARDSKDRTLIHRAGGTHHPSTASHRLSSDTLKKLSRDLAHQRPEQQQQCDAVEAAAAMGRSKVAVAGIKSKRIEEEEFVVGSAGFSRFHRNCIADLQFGAVWAIRARL